MFDYMTISQIIAFFLGIGFSVLSILTCILSVKCAKKIKSFIKSITLALTAPFVAITSWLYLSLSFSPAFIDKTLETICVSIALAIIVIGMIMIVARALNNKHPEHEEIATEQLVDETAKEDKTNVDSQIAAALLLADAETQKEEEIAEIEETNKEVQEEADIQEEIEETGILEELDATEEETDEELEKLIEELTSQETQETIEENIEENTEEVEKIEETEETKIAEETESQQEKIEEVAEEEVEAIEENAETENTDEIEEVAETENTDEIETENVSEDATEEIVDKSTEEVKAETTEEETTKTYNTLQEEFGLNEETDIEDTTEDEEETDTFEDEDDDMTDDEKEFEKFLEALRKRRDFDDDEN